MRKLILLLILLSIAVTTVVSAEEIRLTTIVPDQTILRAKRGAIGETWSNPDPLTGGIPDGSIPTSGLLVEGNVGIGTSTPRSRLEIAGDIQIGNDAVVASASKAGALRYNSGVIEFCNGTSWAPIGGAGGGPVFITPGLLPTLVAGSVRTLDVSTYVPAGATAVILEADVSNSVFTPLLFPVFAVSIRIRRDAASQFYQLFQLTNSGRTEGMGAGPVRLIMEMRTQGTFPITTGAVKSFQYLYTPNSNSYTAQIRIIGYYQ